MTVLEFLARNWPDVLDATVAHAVLGTAPDGDHPGGS